MFQIEIHNLSKKYQRKEVLHNVNMQISNEKYNFILGCNGSGKSTFVKCINGIIDYHGYINNKKYRISYCPEKVNMPDFITLKNFLCLLSKDKKISYTHQKNKIMNYIKNFNIDMYANTPIIKLSQGTKQKILLIQCLVSDADVYIFDEPLNSLDVESERIFINELIKLKEDNKLILIITHQLDKYPFSDINRIELQNG